MVFALPLTECYPHLLCSQWKLKIPAGLYPYHYIQSFIMDFTVGGKFVRFHRIMQLQEIKC